MKKNVYTQKLPNVSVIRISTNIRPVYPRKDINFKLSNRTI